MSDTTDYVSNNTLLGVLIVNIAISVLKPILYKVLHSNAVNKILDKLNASAEGGVENNTPIDAKHVVIDIPQKKTQKDIETGKILSDALSIEISKKT